jgi:uncharacterized protein YyaL (SSP411 family)
MQPRLSAIALATVAAFGLVACGKEEPPKPAAKAAEAAPPPPPPTLVVLRGPMPLLRPWLQSLAPDYRPATAILGIDSVTHDLPEALDKPAAPGRVNAYVCRGVTCLEPVSRIEALRELIGPAGMK